MPPKDTTKTADAPPAEAKAAPLAGVNAEAAHQTAIERMENMVEELELDSRDLVFDVRDFLVEQIKARPKPWSSTSAGEQRDVFAACENTATELVRKIVEAVRSKGVDPVRVLLNKVNAGADGEIVVTGKVKFLDAEQDQRDKAILGLHHAIGKFVMLTRATVEDYAGDGRDPDVDPDQNDFGFEGEDGDPE